jgi:hypothetical protein
MPEQTSSTEPQSDQNGYADPSEGPVPELALYRLLSMADAEVRAELVRQGYEGPLTGVAVGYHAPLEDDEELGDFYQVGCGRLPAEVEESDITDERPEDFKHPLSVDFIEGLADQLEEGMRGATPPDNLEGRELVVRVYGTLYGSYCCWGLAPCDKCNDRKGFYYWCGTCRIWCSGNDCR